MKQIMTIVLSMVATVLVAQSNVSAPMDFYIEKEVVPAVLNIVPGTLQFVDQDNNNVIDANEACKIRFQVVNTGKGDGYGCVARTTFTGNTQGIAISDVRLPVLAAGSKHWVEIPITANAQTQTGEIALNIVVDEPNGFGTEKIESIIGTHKLKTPFINVVSYKVHGGTSGTLKRRTPFILQIVVQNTDQGTAENVKVGMTIPNNMMRTGGDMENISIASLKAGESRILEYELIANQEAADMMDIQIALSEKQGKYAENAIIPLQFGQYLGSIITLDPERNDDDVNIDTVSLKSEVDENIPVTNQNNPNTFVVIIANENYLDVKKVPFALNDGIIFREYCIKTLGIPEKHIQYVPDATGNQIKQKVGWLQNVTKAYADANIIFYYAGHGIPDESSRTAYLLPVDGSGTDVSTGYKLDDLYATLGNIPAKSVMVFMDACFSGSTRNDGKEMLVAARGVAIKARSGMPQGNMVVFSAAQSDETAYPDYEEKHGMFTYYLLKKLQETEGDVTLHELGEYIKTNVSQQSILLNGKSQTPCVTPSATLDASWKEWTLK
jgi:hypothetical protein